MSSDYTNQPPITPPPELVQQWVENFAREGMPAIATQASRWGADQELEACIQLMLDKGWITQSFAENLRTARRTKQPSLKERIIDAVKTGDTAGVLQLLERLPDDSL